VVERGALLGVVTKPGLLAGTSLMQGRDPSA
jgi:hypothetical protein